jgi:hypothetical protein
MKFARLGIAVALVLGALGLFMSRPASGQQPASADTPTTYTRNFPSSSSPFQMLGMRQDAEMAKLMNSENSAAQEVSRLLIDYRRTEKEEEKAKIKTKLGEALTKQFDHQQKRRDLELTRLEEKLKKVRALMKKRDEERKTIVEKRLDQLVREADGLGWAPPPGPRTGAVYGPNIFGEPRVK